MSKDQALSRAQSYIDKGRFVEDVARRVAYRTESQPPAELSQLEAYLAAEMQPTFEAMGYSCQDFANPFPRQGPVLLATRMEDYSLPTILGYGHADVVRGNPKGWTAPFSPWEVHVSGDRVYGRGTADNKGQHTLQIAALKAILKTRGRLGFNSKFIIESSEEMGSIGLFETLRENSDKFSGDVFIASDGPRVNPRKPLLTLGGRGVVTFDLLVESPRTTGRHPGHWGGIAGNPAWVLINALRVISDATGRLLVPAWRPSGIAADMCDALRTLNDQIDVCQEDTSPEAWGEPGLSFLEKIYAWNSFEVLSLSTGHSGTHMNAMPKCARARCQLRYVSGFEGEELLEDLRAYLIEKGFVSVQIAPVLEPNQLVRRATRGDRGNPLVQWIARQLEETSGENHVPILANSSGSNASGSFQRALGIETIWIPLAYRGSNQHAPDEHILLSECRAGIVELVSIYWDIGAQPFFWGG